MASWDSYYVIFLSAVLSLAVPALLATISYLLFGRQKSGSLKKHVQDLLKVADHTALGQKINVRFFLAANAALILISLALELIPCVTTLQSENREGLLKGLLAIVTIAGFAILGLLYSIRKGDMSWLDSFQNLNEGNWRKKVDP